MKTKRLLLTIATLLMALCLSLAMACTPANKDSTPSDSSTTESSMPDSSTPDSSTPDSSTPDEVKELTSITYLSGLDEYAYVKGEELDLSALKITAHYSDGTSAEVAYNAQTFTVNYDSEVEGYSNEGEVVISYEGMSCTHTVLFGSRYQVTGVSAPASYANYKSVVTAESPIFTDVTDSYKVGDDNSFSVRPIVSGVDNFSDDVYTDIANMPFVITVEKWVEDAYVVMDNPGTDVDVDEVKATVDFLENAIGQKYRVSVYPDMLHPDQIEENGLATYTSTVEVVVVDGYNVYDFLGLSLMDNSVNGENTAGEDWAEMRAEAGITTNPNDINGIVLHANLAVSADNIPSSFLYLDGDADLNSGDADYARAVGSLRDSVYILNRTIPAGSKFDIHGNYFNVNSSALPLVVRPGGDIVAEDEAVIPHSSLLRIVCESGYNETLSTVNNLNCLGNLRLADTYTTGGIIFYKVNSLNMLFNNVTARQWYITAFAEISDNEACALKIKNNQYYDNYNSFVYNWGSHVYIENSIMKTCGGPVIIADNCSYKEGDRPADGSHPNGYVPYVKVDDNSVLESWVTGQESWFVQMNATTLAGAIKQLNGLFQYQGGRTFIGTGDNEGKMNLIMVMKSGYAEGIVFESILGKADFGSLKMDMSNQIVQAFAGQSVLFQGASESALGAMYQDGTSQYLADAYNLAMFMATQGAAGSANPIGATHGLFAGDYLGVYLGAAFAGGTPQGYMGVVFGGYKAM